MARKDSVWQIRYGSYIETSPLSGYDILVNGTNKYINFNSISGPLGYGFRDNGGTIEFKNNAGVWTGIGSGGGGGGTWGSITGTLSSQTDLQTALDGKVDENVAITGATKTKITYDAKGLVTSGADATTADIADSLDKRYVTDAQQTVIGNTSGTNTGDNAVNSNYSGLVSNATHTGEMAGDTVLTADPTLISNKTLLTPLVGTEEVLINDAGVLKKTTAQDIADLGGGGGGGSQPYTALSTDTTITQGNVYGVTASAVDITLTLTDGTTAGQTLTVKKLDSTDYTVTIANASIDGETSIELTMEDESVDLYRTGTTFIIK